MRCEGRRAAWRWIVRSILEFSITIAILGSDFTGEERAEECWMLVASAAAEGHAEVSKTSDDAVGVHADVVDADGGLARKPGAQEQSDGLTSPNLPVDGKRDLAEVAADEGLEIGHFGNIRLFGF